MNKQTKQLIEANRGLQKRLKAASKASENNYRGMLFWKERATRLEAGALVIGEWVQRNVRKK